MPNLAAIKVLTIIPQLVKLAERIFGSGTGALKKQWVREILILTLQQLQSQTTSSNPMVEAIIDWTIEEVVTRLKAAGELPPSSTPPAASIYGNPTPLPVPSQPQLVDMGFVTGDIVYVSTTENAWLVVQPAQSGAVAQQYKQYMVIG